MYVRFTNNINVCDNMTKVCRVVPQDNSSDLFPTSSKFLLPSHVSGARKVVVRLPLGGGKDQERHWVDYIGGHFSSSPFCSQETNIWETPDVVLIFEEDQCLR